MANKIIVERVLLKTLQRYHQATINTFGEHEALVDAVTARPGFFAPSPVAFLSLVARRPTIKTKDLDEAILNDRTLIRVNSLRGPLFLLSSADYPIYHRALFSIRKRTGLQTLFENGISERILGIYAQKIRDYNSSIPLSHYELIEVLFRAQRRRPDPMHEQLIINKLCDLGVLVRAASKGWKGNQYTYACFNKWLPDTKLSLENPEAARLETVRKYLRCYGPAEMDDISWWTGLPQIQIRRAITNLKREILHFPVEGFKEELIGLKESYEAISRNQNDDDTIQLLPPWDPFLLGWLNHRRITTREFAPYIYDSAGNSTSVLVRRGKVIGLWQFREQQNPMLEFHIFNPYKNLRQKIIYACEKHARLLAEITGSLSVDIIEKSMPLPLDKGPIGSFLWPLGKNPPNISSTLQSTSVSAPLQRNTFKSSYLDHKYVTGSSPQIYAG